MSAQALGVVGIEACFEDCRNAIREVDNHLRLALGGRAEDAGHLEPVRGEGLGDALNADRDVRSSGGL